MRIGHKNIFLMPFFYFVWFHIYIFHFKGFRTIGMRHAPIQGPNQMEEILGNNNIHIYLLM